MHVRQHDVSKNKKKLLTFTFRYMDLMELFKPDIILAIADGRTTLMDSNKRNLKAIERSNSFLDTCVDRYKVSKELRHSALVGKISYLYIVILNYPVIISCLSICSFVNCIIS